MIKLKNEVILNLIKNKEYIVKPFLFKVIKENKIDLNEFILLIYLSNQEHPELDLTLINKITNLTKEEILSSFSTLTKKGLISTIITKNDERVIEEISLDGLYKVSVININNDMLKEEEENIFDLFEKEFNRKLTPMEYELINAWLNSGMNEEVIKEALKEATYNGVSNLRYIDKIIYEWTKKGYKTKEDIENGKLKREDNEKASVELFDYNWLDEK